MNLQKNLFRRTINVQNVIHILWFPRQSCYQTFLLITFFHTLAVFPPFFTFGSISFHDHRSRTFFLIWDVCLYNDIITIIKAQLYQRYFDFKRDLKPFLSHFQAKNMTEIERILSLA